MNRPGFARWDRVWPGVEPIGWRLRQKVPERWVRFHSLPGSKRYPEGEAEMQSVLDRHHALLTALLGDRGGDLVVTVVTWPHWPLDFALLPGAGLWRLFVPEDDAGGSPAIVWAGAIRSDDLGALDPLLRQIADGRYGGAVTAPRDLAWLYHPYDGGGDVIAATLGQRAHLMSRFADWLSNHPSGQ
ncbi:DUF3885 domain-containing protein [Actinospica acidithermotolerans]|uniref:DUF3885 domain-containing protein n=1 Tax=Actinospica acidithermotolerans TaxID=2828514 RepID=UPI003FD6D3E7